MELIVGGGGTGTVNLNDGMWGQEWLAKTTVLPNSIELIYVQTSMVTLAIWPPQPPAQRAIKRTYSCVDGKWHMAQEFGDVIPAKGQDYSFPSEVDQ